MQTEDTTFNQFIDSTVLTEETTTILTEVTSLKEGTTQDLTTTTLGETLATVSKKEMFEETTTFQSGVTQLDDFMTTTQKLKTTTIIDEAFDREMQNMTSIERLQRVEKMSLIDQAKYSSIFSDLADLKPIHKRVSNIEIELLLQKEFKNRDLDLDFV